MSAQQSAGIYLLSECTTHTADPNSRIKYIDHEWIGGLAARLGVTDFCKQPNVYDFRLIDDGIRRCKAIGKKYAIQIRVQEMPPFVVSAAVDKYMTVVPLRGSAVRRVTTCAPWDQPSLAWYRQFLRAFGDHTIDGIPLRAHPNLGPIRCSTLGREHTARENHDSLRAISGYTREKYIKAVDDSLAAIRAEFPNAAIHTGYFSVKDGIKRPSLDSLLIPIVASHGIGFFEELLSGNKPENDGSYASNLRLGRSLGSFVAFQALGRWLDHSPGEWQADDLTPANGFRHGYEDFGATYFELYKPDLMNREWEGMFREWQERLGQ